MFAFRSIDRDASRVLGRGMTHVAIIGGGASAVSVLAHLTLGATDRVTTLSHQSFGPGRAYGELEESALLNRPTYKMSVSNHDPVSFVTWLDEKHPRENREYVPRRVYGDYLADYARAIKLDAAFEYSQISCDVVDVVPAGSGYKVCFEDNNGGRSSLDADKVVLALGAIVPGDPYGLNGSEGYFADVYPISKWLDYSAGAGEVAILGSGLSGVDAALAATGASSTTHVTLYSRRGVAPDVRSPIFNIRPDSSLVAYIQEHSDSGFKIAHLQQLMKSLCAKHDIDSKRLADAIELLRREPESRFADMNDAPHSVDAAVQGCILDLAQNYITPAWALMDKECRKEFLDSYHTVFQSFANPLPPETGRAIGRLCRTGRLSFRAGLESVTRTDGHWKLTCNGGSQVADIVVNSTKTTTGQLAPEANTLIQNMIRRGMVAENSSGGFEINPETNRVISSDGGELLGMFAIGECTVESLYYISAMTKIRNRAQAIARSICSPNEVYCG